METSRLIYGIDVGTTGCRVAGIDETDRAVVMRNLDGDLDTPTVVYFEDENRVVVGRDAADMWESGAENAVAFVRRELEESARTGEAKAVCPYGYDAEVVMALLLKNVVDGMNALKDTVEPIRNVVLTVPHWYGINERRKMWNACALAELNLVALIPGVTAALLSYQERTGERWRGVVCDLGEGTFEAAVVDADGEKVRVVACDGDRHFGGMDWDMALAKYALEALNREHGTVYALEDDVCLKRRLLREAEMKKKQLTARQSVRWNVFYEGRDVPLEITRKLFEVLTAELMDLLVESIHRAVDRADEQGFGDIKECMLVGGATKMPQVKERLEREFGWTVRLEEPGQCMAKGAAIYGRRLLYERVLFR